MKARIPVHPLPERVLCYSIEEAMQLPLTAVLQELGIEEYRVSSQELGQTVGCLAGLQNYPRREDTQAFPVECQGVLCMCGLSSARMDLLLRTLHQRGVVVPIKATLTAINQSWSFGKLVQELTKEHEAISRMRGKK